MGDNQEEINRLQAQLDRLVRTQIDFQREVSFIRSELERLSSATPARPMAPVRAEPVSGPGTKLPGVEPGRTIPQPEAYSPPPKSTTSTPGPTVDPPNFGYSKKPFSGAPDPARTDAKPDFVSAYFESARGNLEKFIGENLISKIGIIILVLGVGIGAKYAIDNGWISPLLRIVFGYIMGFGLLGIAVRLKSKYLSFSAVLLSGGMAIMYFVTYFAFAPYHLIGQISAFALMAMFTVFTVAAALLYNRQVIAHIGLVGAYAVPFLLSDNSGNYQFLFTYMAVINTGVLAISVRKFWKPLFYTSSGFTWIIFAGWMLTKYSASGNFYLALVFLGIFFAFFYATRVIHGVVHHEINNEENLASIIITAIVFYAFCYAISDVRAGVFQYSVLFTYLAVISLAILLTSYRFYGRVLVYVACPLTWLIFGVWFGKWYTAEEHFVLAWVFAVIFFGIFYFATLIYRLATDDIGLVENTGLVLTNSFVFYGLGYAILDSRPELRGFEGLFTAGHAVLHSIVAQAVSRFKASAVDVVQVLAILIITFSTIAIPIQFDGNRITLIWSVEAAALFWFGRARHIRLFEYFSYAVMCLAALSMFDDWVIAYSQRTSYISDFNRHPLANGDLVTALVFVAAFAFIYVTNQRKKDEPVIGDDLVRPFGYLVAACGLFVLYNAFRIEIGNYFHMQAVLLGDPAGPVIGQLGPSLQSIRDLTRFNIIWQLNYTMFFLSAVCILNLSKIRAAVLGNINLVFSILSLLVFVTVGMFLFFELRVSYLYPDPTTGNAAGPINIGIRYFSYAFTGLLLWSIYLYKRDVLLSDTVPVNVLTIGFDALLCATLFIASSCELVNLMVQFQIADSSKLGLSILWGVFALTMVVIGIAVSKAHLRIAAIVLFAVTLAKLFLYDIANLPTIPKTILFITIGLLLLIVSFLYNKYKAIIFKAAAVSENQS